eukprot:Trichotokara_eunicae@DN2845_c0_g1_i3.p1
MLYLFLFGNFPFTGPTTKAVNDAVTTKDPTWALNERIRYIPSFNAVDLCKQLLQKSPQKRRTATYALSHHWFKRDSRSVTEIPAELRNLSRKASEKLYEKGKKKKTIRSMK